MVLGTLVAVSLVLTYIGTRSSYWVLKFMAGIAWLGTGGFWRSNTPTVVTAGSSSDTIVLMLFMTLGVAMLLMPLWYTKNENGVEVGRGFRIPFMKSEEDEPKPYTPNRVERNSDYANRVSSALNGTRISRRR